MGGWGFLDADISRGGRLGTGFWILVWRTFLKPPGNVRLNSYEDQAWDIRRSVSRSRGVSGDPWGETTEKIVREAFRRGLYTGQGWEKGYPLRRGIGEFLIVIED